MTPSRRIEFSLFDWLDDSGLPLTDLYETRLRVLEVADQANFYAYHLAEHHGIALSTTPSPNIFLSSVAQRTKRLRIGAMTYVLPLYNPLRLMEELCMLDHISAGRLDIGLSRGSGGSGPSEGSRYGVQRDDARDLFEEALDLILTGFRTGEFNHHGRFFTYDDVHTRFRPRQLPYPPLWYPTSNLESVPWVAKHAFNTIFSLRLARSMDKFLAFFETHRREYEAHKNDPDRLNGHIAQPFVGVQFHVYVAPTDAEAREVARTAYRDFHTTYTSRPGRAPGETDPPDVDRMIDNRELIVGSPSTVRDMVRHYLDLTGANYFLGAFTYGSLTPQQMMTSVDLFGREVIPAFQPN